MRKLGVLAFSVCGVLFALVWMFAGLQPQIALGAPLRQNQPNGSTIVSPQTTSGTWGPGIITATSNVVINAGVIITVAPNTTVRVVGNRLFTINGNLHSDGPITFTDSSAIPGAWQGILYAAGSTGYLNAATVQYAQQAVALNTANPITISNSTLRYNLEQTGGNTAASGAGLTIQLGSPLISNTQIYSNTTSSVNGNSLGAGLYIVAGTPTIQGCQIFQNAAVSQGSGSAFGGGVYIQTGNPLITNTLVYTNVVQGSNTVYGGGIAIDAGSPQIVNSRVYQNLVTTPGTPGYGGGISIRGTGSPVIQNSYVTTNSLLLSNSSSYAEGAGISIWDNTGTVIRDNWIGGNVNRSHEAGGGGIGLALNANAALIDGNVIYNNTVTSPGTPTTPIAFAEGGGIDFYANNRATASNNLIYGNVSLCDIACPLAGGYNLEDAAGGGIFGVGTDATTRPTLVNNTVVSNTSGVGGGLGLQWQVTFYNNIIVSNTARTRGGGIYLSQNTGITRDYNDVGGNTAPADANYALYGGTLGPAANDLQADPWLLGAGDLAQWHHLRQGSPAIDDGTNTGVGLPTDDYDGDARPLGTTWDIGFDEIRSLTLTKTVTPAMAGAGDLLTYTLVISNPDRIAPLIGGVISDTVPPSTTYASGPSCTSGTCSYNAGNQAITWNTDLSAGNQTTLTYAVTANASVPRGVPITNSFQIPWGSGIRSSNVVTTLLVPRVSFSSATYSVTESAGTATITVTLDARSLLPATVNYATSNGTATAPSDYLTSTGTLTFAPGATTATFTVTIVNNPIVEPNETVTLTLSAPGNAVLGPPNPATLIIIDAAIANLQISKAAAPSPVVSGGILTYTLTYTNIGPFAALNVRITDTLPVSVTWGGVTSAVPPITLTGTTPPAWFTPTLALGASGKIVFTTTVTAPGGSVLTNQAVITTTTTETITANNTASVTTTVISPVVMTISKRDAPDPVMMGNTLVYTITYANTGGTTATGVVITETYDAGVIYQSANPPPSVGNNVWNLGSVGAGVSNTIVISVTPNAVGVLTNVVAIDSAQTPPVTTSVTTTVIPQPPSFVLTKSGAPDPVLIGSNLTYNINYQNVGGNATGVVITETYDSNVSFISAVPAPTSGNNVWSIGALSADGPHTIVVTVHVNGGTTLTNKVTMTSTQGVSATATAINTTVVAGQVSIGKTVMPTTFPGAGQWVTYTILITNAGPTSVPVQQITDTLPVGFTYVTTTATSVIRFPEAINVSGQTITWSYSPLRPSIPAGSTATLTFVATTGVNPACNSAGVTIQGSIGLVAADNLACLGWPEYLITAQTGSQTIRVRVRLVNNLPVILSWEFLP